jgi:non-ribosomal peptide synthetase component F
VQDVRSEGRAWQGAVADRPSDAALIFHDRRWITARELARVGSWLTSAVRLTAGPASAAVVLLALPSGPDLIALVQACFREHMTFVLTGPEPASVREAVAATRPHVVVSATAAGQPASTTTGIGGGQLALTRCPAVPDDEDTGPGTAGWGYIIGTSGTTGTRRYCVISHDSLTLHVGRMARELGLGPDDTVLQAASPTFDVWIEEVLPSLGSGARIAVSGEGLRCGPSDLVDLMRRAGVTVLNLPTSYFRVLTQWLESDPRHQLPDTVRLAVVGSEVVTADVARSWLRVTAGRIPMIAAYGLSEATITSLVYHVQDERSVASAPVLPLGTPLRGTTWRLDGHHGHRELVLTGRDVQLGYLDPTTSRTLMPPPGGTTRDGLPTGDLVDVDSEGRLFFTGRSDDLTKVNGIRVSTAHLETALEAIPGVEAAAVVKPSSPGGQAGALIQAGDCFQPAALNAACRESRPLAGLRLVVQAGPLPVTGRGKLDRAEIARIIERSARSSALAAGSERGVLPVTALMSTILGSPLGDTDDFFAAGGHSLLALALLVEVEARFGTRLSFAELFSHRTGEQVSHLIQAPSPQRRATTSRLPATVPTPERIPLTGQQEAIWYLSRFGGISAAYHCQSSVEFDGRLDLERLDSALQAVIRRNAVYHTVFGSVRGRPVARFRPGMASPLSCLRVTSDAEAQAAERRFIAAPFDLESGPLIRMLAIERQQATKLVLVEHHLVHDGYSFGLLVRQLGDLYGADDPGLRAGGVDDTYARYALWQRDYMSSAEAEQSLEHLTTLVAGQPAAGGLFGRPGHDGSHVAVVERHRLSQGAVNDLRRACPAYGVTTSHAITAAFAGALRRYTGCDMFSLGMGFANRDVPETQRALGMFVNALPVPVTASGGQARSGLLRQLASTMTAFLDHQRIPQVHLVRALARPQVGTRSPLFDCLIGFDHVPVGDITLGGKTGRLTELPNGAPKLPLSLTVLPPMERRTPAARHADPWIDVLAEFDPAYFSPAGSRRLMCYVDDELAAIAATVSAGA